MKIEVTLPLERETKGALLYRDQKLADRNPLYLIDGVYVRKAGMTAAYTMTDGSPFKQYPKAIKITIEEG